jgi:excisionase family DNA binding protein
MEMRVEDDTAHQRMFSVPEVADELHLKERMVRRLIDQGELDVHRFGRHVRVSDEDLGAYVSRSRANSSPTPRGVPPRRQP